MGRNGSDRLRLGGEEALGGQQLAAPLQPGEQLAQADHPDLAHLQRQGAAVGVDDGLACTTTLAPSTSGGLSESTRVREQVSGTDTSASVSRRVTKTVAMPGRRLTWVTWPSTQIAPRRSTQPAIAVATWRTGAGAAVRSQGHGREP